MTSLCTGASATNSIYFNFDEHEVVNSSWKDKKPFLHTDYILQIDC